MATSQEQNGKLPMYLIEVEGITGGGKTTLIPHLESYLKSLGYRVFCSKEPGFTHLGLDIRTILINKHHKKISEITQMLLFLANRSDIYEKHLNRSKYDFAIFDRYYGSTVVYQVLMADEKLRKNYQSLLDKAMKIIAGRYWRVNMTILLDVSPKIAYSRIKTRQKIEYRSTHEASNYESFLNQNSKLRKCFNQYLHENKKISQRILIDANGSVKNTTKLVFESLNSMLCNFRS